jgi:hypothetical protein
LLLRSDNPGSANFYEDQQKIGASCVAIDNLERGALRRPIECRTSN